MMSYLGVILHHVLKLIIHLSFMYLVSLFNDGRLFQVHLWMCRVFITELRIEHSQNDGRNNLSIYMVKSRCFLAPKQDFRIILVCHSYSCITCNVFIKIVAKKR